MATLLWVVLIGLGLLLAVVIGALALPLRCELDLIKDDVWHFKAAARPFGRFGPRIPMSRSKKTADKDKPARKKKKRARTRKRNLQNIGRAALQLVVDFMRCVKIDTAMVDVRFGLGDPAETGHAYGILAPIIYGCPQSSRVRMTVEPVFDRAVLNGRASLVVCLTPAALLGPVLRFGWSFLGSRR